MADSDSPFPVFGDNPKRWDCVRHPEDITFYECQRRTDGKYTSLIECQRDCNRKNPRAPQPPQGTYQQTLDETGGGRVTRPSPGAFVR